jgi:molybdopterin synthase catalytic subunit
MIELTKESIEIGSYLSQVQDDGHGALCIFLGVVRNIHEGRSVERIYYDCYEKMALNMLRKIEDQTRSKFERVEMVIVHRIGLVELGEASILVATGSKHRKTAYAANSYIMDRVKEVLPVWKKEVHPDGATSWVGIGS